GGAGQVDSGDEHGQRLPRGAAAQGRFGELGPARRTRRRVRDLRRLRRLALRPRAGRLGRARDRRGAHGRHVRVHGARPRRDVLGAPGRGRRLHVRPRRHGPVGRVRDGGGDPARVRRGPGGHRHLHRRLRRVPRPVRDHRRLVGLPRLLRALRRDPPARGGRGAQGHVRHRRDRAGRAGPLRDRRGRVLRRREPHRHPRHRRRRRLAAAAARPGRGVGELPVRDLVLPRGRGRPARRRGGTRPRAGGAARDHRRDGDPGGERGRRPGPRARSAGRARSVHQREPAGQRAGGRLRRVDLDLHHGQLHRAARADRELLLDHLRLLAPDLRPLACRLPAPRAVEDQRPQGADAGADHPRRHRLRARRVRQRRHPHQPRRVRGDAVLRADDGGPPGPAHPQPRHAPALPDAGRARHHRRRPGARARGRGGHVPRRRRGGPVRARGVRGAHGVVRLLLTSPPRRRGAGRGVRGPGRGGGGGAV
ncbi:MAG: Ethanolamine permease, partial [uncultured Actinomycetospora sp.]